MKSIKIEFSSVMNRRTSLEINSMTEAMLAERFLQQDSQLERRLEDFTTRAAQPIRTRRFGRTICHIVADPKDKFARLKIEQLEVALDQIAGAGSDYALPRDILKVYCVTAWSSAISDGSVGMVHIDKTRPRSGKIATLILGDSVVSTPCRLIADDVYDYYAKTALVNAQKKRVLTTIFHELGHIFHQLLSPNHYFGLSDIFSSHGAGESGMCTSRSYSSLHGAPSHPKLDNFITEFRNTSRLISNYATSHPNEAVAETFAGLMMGVPPFGEHVSSMYQAFGGPQPTPGMAHERKGYSWFSRRVVHPIGASRH